MLSYILYFLDSLPFLFLVTTALLVFTPSMTEEQAELLRLQLKEMGRQEEVTGQVSLHTTDGGETSLHQRDT